MIRCIVADLDGTLYDESHAFNQETVDVIKKLQDKGVEFILATGRHVRFIGHEEWGLKVKKVTLNGARVYDEEDRLLFESPIQAKDIEELVPLFEKNDVVAVFHLSEKSYSSDRKRYLENIKSQIGEEGYRVLMVYGKLDQVDDDKGMVKTLQDKDKIFKIEVDDAFMTDEVYDFVKKSDTMKIVNSNHCFEITSVEARKELALKRLMKELGYERDEVMVFGDSENDRGMLAYFPNSYAMENGHPSAKEVANHVAPSNREYGVLQVLRRKWKDI